jgi:hypothetical protein
MGDGGYADATGGEAVESTGLDVESSTPEADVDATPEVSETQESEPSYLFEVEGEGITLDAARDGYLRQADYTRKTQELSERRKSLQTAEAIQTAFDRDPRATLKALADAYSVDLGELAPRITEDMDPSEQELIHLRQRVEQFERANNQSVIERDLASLREQYGDFDEGELYNHAIAGRFPTMRAAYADLNFDRIAQVRAAEEKAKAGEASREAAKRDAQVVEGSSSRAGTKAVQPKKPASVRDAFEAAFQQIKG